MNTLCADIIYKLYIDIKVYKTIINLSQTCKRYYYLFQSVRNRIDFKFHIIKINRNLTYDKNVNYTDVLRTIQINNKYNRRYRTLLLSIALNDTVNFVTNVHAFECFSDHVQKFIINMFFDNKDDLQKHIKIFDIMIESHPYNYNLMSDVMIRFALVDKLERLFQKDIMANYRISISIKKIIDHLDNNRMTLEDANKVISYVRGHGPVNIISHPRYIMDYVNGLRRRVDRYKIEKAIVNKCENEFIVELNKILDNGEEDIIHWVNVVWMSSIIDYNNPGHVRELFYQCIGLLSNDVMSIINSKIDGKWETINVNVDVVKEKISRICRDCDDSDCDISDVQTMMTNIKDYKVISVNNYHHILSYEKDRGTNRMLKQFIMRMMNDLMKDNLFYS